ncbi:PIN domain-containing protein [uncultured Phocaeicola sp.]|uniref:type II toxin-antitoxin system VapC family toxin n=1 Tax=uncultured Phocaeicola sp. TaxID=990718 RepID=UPI0025EF9CC7|nr:PIN domain-containing protein [uncultured Phocaeicola sp.]
MLDTNVVVDSVKFREPYVRAIVPIFQMGQVGIHQLVISDLTFANVAYLTKKGLSLFEWYNLLCELRSNVQIVPIGETSVDAALKLRSKDFEDALQYFSAKEADVDCIITRNKKDFNFSDIPVLDPIEFIAK